MAIKTKYLYEYSEAQYEEYQKTVAIYNPAIRYPEFKKALKVFKTRNNLK